MYLINIQTCNSIYVLTENFIPIIVASTFSSTPANLVIDMIFLAHSLENTIDWLWDHGLLARGMICKCGLVMNEGRYCHSQDGCGWRCPNVRKYVPFVTVPFLLHRNFPFLRFSSSSTTGVKIYKLMRFLRNT